MKKKYYLSFAFVLFCGVSGNTWAEGHTFTGGAGTTDDPYQVVTVDDLKAVGDYTAQSSVCFKLMNDIDLTGVVWNPIGSTIDNAFKGTFDGNGKVITGLEMTGASDGLGFFGRIQAPGVVKNLTIYGAYIEGGNWCGIICSTNGNWEKKGGSIVNCKVINSQIDGLDNIGGIVGVNEGNIDNCQVLGVTVTGGAGIAAVSGFNQCIGTGRYVRNCVATGSVEGTKQVGGIIGFLQLEQAVEDNPGVQNCANYCTVTASEDAVGGIVGYQQGIKTTVIDNNFNCGKISGPGAGGIGGSPIDGIVQNCYSTGDVVASALNTAVWSGGITGTSYQSISGCYAAGSITGSGDIKIGGICGRNWPSLTVTNCFYNKDGAAMNMGEGHDEVTFDAQGLALNDMKSLSNMKFNNADKWQIIEGQTFPFFVNQTAPVSVEKCAKNGAEGSYTGNLSQFYVLSAYGELLDITTEIGDGKWSVRWDETFVLEKDRITFIAMEDGKMPSYSVIGVVNDEMLPVGIEDVKAESGVTINIGKESIDLSVPENVANAQVFLYNIGSLACVYGSGLNCGYHTISTANFVSGVYALLVRTNLGTSVIKIVR